MTDMPRSYVAVMNIKVTNDNIIVMKNKHLKIKTVSNIDLIIWDCINDIDDIVNNYINVVAKCNANSWNGNISPQLICEEWEKSGNVPVVDSWGF